jgi:hypothetical protein
MPEVLTHGSAFSVTLDKGVFTGSESGLKSTLEVSTVGFRVLEQEAAVQSDIEATLAKLIAGLMYEQGAFKAGTVTFNKVSKITLSELSNKGTAPLVLRGELECTLDIKKAVDPAINPPKGAPDGAPPTKAIVTFASVQSLCQSK